MWEDARWKFADVLDDVDWIGILDEEANMADRWSEVRKEVGKALLRIENEHISNSSTVASFGLPDRTDSLHHFDTAS